MLTRNWDLGLRALVRQSAADQISFCGFLSLGSIQLALLHWFVDVNGPVQVLKAVSELELQRKAMEERPGTELAERTKRLRQLCFKASYKKRRMQQAASAQAVANAAAHAAAAAAVAASSTLVHNSQDASLEGREEDSPCAEKVGKRILRTRQNIYVIQLFDQFTIYKSEFKRSWRRPGEEEGANNAGRSAEEGESMYVRGDGDGSRGTCGNYISSVRSAGHRVHVDCVGE
ncbi:hypothetical protein CBR_g4617 [Chara braunii]|uniref:Uncharacterized protein n=1 Tax=Chara braunii TaxID=69332 RepID=A0A388KIC8_CHABU|nr:hypothetical protein CBR_g4617 [Chara braunii]|eukprot:GBG69786.1 hypothetical protein CBR_g4617 [Chara braunii]